MALSDSVKDLINIIDEEGFGYLISDMIADLTLFKIQHDDPTISRRDGADQFLPESDQLVAAVNFLRIHLIYPAYALANAEEIAGNISDQKPIRIKFIDRDRREDLFKSILNKDDKRADPGNIEFAKKLNDVLGDILLTLTPQEN